MQAAWEIPEAELRLKRNRPLYASSSFAAEAMEAASQR